MKEMFNFPSVDHLTEGVHYNSVEWDFSTNNPKAPANTPGESCPPGHKMVFGICRKLKEGGQEWDPSGESEQEKGLKAQAQKSGSSAGNNKAVESGGKKFGWAIKGGKPVMVEWGSVAGVKKAPDKAATEKRVK